MKNDSKKKGLFGLGAIAIGTAAALVFGCDEGLAEAEAGETAIFGAAAPDGEAVAQEAKDARGFGRDARWGHRHLGERLRDGGRGGSLVFLARTKLDLSDEQRAAVEALGRERGRGKAKRGPRGDRPFHQAVIEALRTGEVDRAAFEPRRGVDGEPKRRFEERGEAVEKLHAILTPKQREELVAVARERLSQMDDADPRSRMRDGQKKGATGRHHARHGDERAWMGGSFARAMTVGLELTEAQKERIDALEATIEKRRPGADAVEAKRDDRKARIEAMLDAFAKDELDASAIAPPRPLREDSERGACMADAMEGLIDILTQEQREELAARLEDGRGGHRDGRRHGDGFGREPFGRGHRNHGRSL